MLVGGRIPARYDGMRPKVHQKLRLCKTYDAIQYFCSGERRALFLVWQETCLEQVFNSRSILKIGSICFL
jgi:hypothetical protein